MGLDISPGGAQWSYSGFARFRERIAKREGIDLPSMEGFGGEKSWSAVEGQSALIPLLNHSDCDGYLEDYECEQMLPRLRAILAEDVPGADLEWRYDMQSLGAMVRGMEHCVEHGCTMAFR